MAATGVELSRGVGAAGARLIGSGRAIPRIGPVPQRQGRSGAGLYRERRGHFDGRPDHSNSSNSIRTDRHMLRF